MLLITSDPIISQIISMPRKKSSFMNADLRLLLLEPAFTSSHQSSDEESTDFF